MIKIGYPCINLSLKCRPNKTFRLKSYTEKRLVEVAENNIKSLKTILDFNVKNGLLFFRITSDLIPFASHPVCKFNWQKHFEAEFARAGAIIRKNGIRISMHPDQFTLINSPDTGIFENSGRELFYHADILNLMGLDETAKIQIHVGGVYGDKKKSMRRFVKRYKTLSPDIKRRLVIENDDRSYNTADCLLLNDATGIPVLLDVFHDFLNPSGIGTGELFPKVRAGWRKDDGVPMLDYSSQLKGGKPGMHAKHIDMRDFKKFLAAFGEHDVDVMLEIKDKEASAVEALRAISQKRGCGRV